MRNPRGPRAASLTVTAALLTALTAGSLAESHQLQLKDYYASVPGLNVNSIGKRILNGVCIEMNVVRRSCDRADKRGSNGNGVTRGMI